MCKRPVRLILVATVSLVSALPLRAGPITFNSALPVSRGEVIVRSQFIYLRSGTDSSPMNRELRVIAVPLVAVWGITEKLALFGIVPILDKTLEVRTPSGVQRRAASGAGDATILVRYTSYKRDAHLETVRIAPFAGIKAPTGSHDERDGLGVLPRPLQPGSGSWDLSAGMIVTRQTVSSELDASISYTINGRADHFELGDQGRVDLSLQRRLFPRELGEGVPHFLYAVVESNVIWQGRNKAGGSADPDSGGTTVYLAPGLQWVSKRFVVEAAIQIPVAQDLNGTALENDFISTLSARVNF